MWLEEFSAASCYASCSAGAECESGLQPVLPLRMFRLGQFDTNLYTSHYGLAPNPSIFGLEMAEWIRKVPFCPNF